MPKPTRLELVVPVVAMLLMLFATTAYAAWTIRTVDTGNTLGNIAAIANINGKVAISHSNDEGVIYAERSGSGWATTTVAEDAGDSTSLAVINGQPAIAFEDFNSPAVRYARFNGTSWATEPIELGSQTAFPGYPALAQINGQPAVTYVIFSSQGTTLRYARHNGNQWQPETIVTLSNINLLAKLVVWDDRPTTLYQDPTSGNLTVATRVNNAWQTLDIQPTVNFVIDSDIAIINGQPAVVYTADNEVNLAEYNGATWNTQTIGTYSGGGALVSIGMLNNEPIIAYYDGSVSRLYQRTGNTIENTEFDTFRDISYDVVGINDVPAVAYYADVNGTRELRLAFPTQPEDVNGDDIVSPADAISVINRVGQTPINDLAMFDVNDDGAIDAADVQAVLNRGGRTLP